MAPFSPPRPCRIGSCPELVTPAAPCPVHGLPYRTHEQTKQERGYGGGWERLSRAVLERDRSICQYCGAEATTADHIVPKHLGGADELSNLVAACRSCNSRKAGRV